MRKKIIAREVLIFFACIISFVGAWGFIAARNAYYHHCIESIPKPSKGKLVEITDPAILNAEEIPMPAYAAKLVEGDRMLNYLLISAIVIAGIAYVLRFSIIAVLWAIKTMKHETTAQGNAQGAAS